MNHDYSARNTHFAETSTAKGGTPLTAPMRDDSLSGRLHRIMPLTIPAKRAILATLFSRGVTADLLYDVLRREQKEAADYDLHAVTEAVDLLKHGKSIHHEGMGNSGADDAKALIELFREDIQNTVIYKSGLEFLLRRV
jgi:hypothetical protein